MSDQRAQADEEPTDDLPVEPPPPDDEPLETEPPRPPARVEPVVVPRWIQLVMLPLAVLALWALARAAGPVVLIFIVAAVIALILNPLVKIVRRGRMPRGLAIAVVYVGFFLAVGGAIALLVNPVANQVQSLQREFPRLIDSANASLADFQGWLDDRGIGIEVKGQGETALETLRDQVLRGSGDVLSFTQDIVTVLVEAGFALILILVISIYMLLYGDRVGALVRGVMPPGDGTPEDDYPIRAQKAVFGFVRGQLAFSLIMGLTAGVALWIFGALGIFPDGKTYAVFFGVWFGVMEMIPYLGPVLGSAAPILVALFQDPLTAVWVALLCLAIQQLEGHVVAPQVFGHTLRINPLLVIFALLVGGKLYGIVGALVALPLLSVGRETAIYLRRHLVLEPWGTPTPQAIEAGKHQGAQIRAPACPECGAPRAEEDSFCRACGAALESPAATP